MAVKIRSTDDDVAYAKVFSKQELFALARTYSITALCMELRKRFPIYSQFPELKDEVLASFCFCVNWCCGKLEPLDLGIAKQVFYMNFLRKFI